MAVIFAALLPVTAAGASEKAKVPEAKAEGYLEWRQGDLLIVDAQQVRPGPGFKFKGQGDVKDVAAIPLGWEVKAEGTRTPDGVLLAKKVEAKVNGKAMFEGEVQQATDQAEQSYVKAGQMFQTAADGRMQTIGRLYESGPEVDRARRIVNTLAPPYLSPEDFRVYVVDNKEWNAMAMGNRSIYVFSGLMKDTDDDELAIVLGHELVHATHEHTRKQFKKQMWIQIAALGVSAAAQEIDDRNKQAVVGLVTLFGAMAVQNGYGRSHEDQADRVGLRYAYEAGYDITKAPRLWNRFAKKYGESNKVATFFFSDHSQSSARAAKLEKEIAFNYPDGPKTGNTAKARAAADAARNAPARTSVASSPARGAAPAGGAALAPGGQTQKVDLKPGMTPEEVRGALGNPQNEVVFGGRTKWSYPDLTVIFENGRVREVKF
jgi:Zn-dependent protease with chaperone function